MRVVCILDRGVHGHVCPHEHFALVLGLTRNLVTDFVDVAHEMLSLIECLLTLIDLLGVEIYCRLHLHGILVQKLLLLVHASTRWSVAILHVLALGEEVLLHLSIHLELLIDLDFNSTVLVLPGLEVVGNGLSFLISGSLKIHY